MLVTNRQSRPLDDYLQFITCCAVSGITSVQMREKGQDQASLLMFGQQLKMILDPLHIPLIINDDVELALKLNASGVHLGQSDGDPIRARERLGPEAIIGVSIDFEKDVMVANRLPIDYVGVGAIFPSESKKNITTIWGIEGLQQLAPHSKHPIIGIGGIDLHNASEVLEAGADGIAIIGALHQTPTPTQMVHQFCQIIKQRMHDDS